MASARRILYVVSFDSAEAAVSWQVAQLARAMHAPVVLLAARARRRWRIGRDRNADETGRRLTAIATTLKGYAADLRVTEEPISDAAVRIATEVDAGLIVVGAGERAAQEPAFMSADALKIARAAREDVLICKPFADPYIGHVLCAADTTPTAGDAVKRAAELSRRFNALMRIVSVMPEPMWTSANDDPDEQARVQRETQKAFLDQFDFRGVPLSREVTWARNAAPEVLDEAERYGEGLLVIGASSRDPLPSGQLGPTAESIVSACPCSVLIVKRRYNRSIRNTRADCREGMDTSMPARS